MSAPDNSGRTSATLTASADLSSNATAHVGDGRVGEAIGATLAERGSRYGAFIDHATIAQSLQTVMRGTDAIATNWNHLAPDMQQALTVIADKIARILNGDPSYIDNWHDIQGYALLVERRLSDATPSSKQEGRG